MNTIRYSDQVMTCVTEIEKECMGMEDAFCKSRCPMSTDVTAYVHQIAEGDYIGAVRTIREKLFLPGTLGRICAHPCEGECRREREFQQAISIAALKRFAADQADSEALWDTAVGAATGKRVAVIGAGPSGAQAAIDLRKAGHEVVIYEKLSAPGGMLRVGIPSFRLSPNVLDFEYSYLDKLGIAIKYNTEIGTDIEFESLRSEYDAVLIANGAHKGSIVSVAGSESEGVYTALEFLKEVRETKAFPRAGSNLLVVGGGDVAMDCARSAIRLGLQNVYLCSLEDLDILPASEEERDLALEEGVICSFGWGPAAIHSENGRVTGIQIQKVASVYDSEGRFHPSYEEEYQEISVDTIIMATGQVVEDVTDGALPRGRGGRYIVNPDTLATSDEKVFVAGDAAGGHIVVEAMALGRKAAVSIDRYLKGIDLFENRDLKSEWSYESRLDVPLPEGTKDEPRIRKNLRPVEERIKDFELCDLGFTEEQARGEAGRCLQCQCRLCLKECVMLDTYGTCPKEVIAPVLAGGTMDTKTVYACNDCDNCTIACPKDLPVRRLFMEARRDIAAANRGNTVIPGHRAVRIQQELGFSSMYTAELGGEQ
ncbi:MAG: FAD-dependent oxidoreductase [Clostridiales bacterium]|nr:FAD-dependent oxidoreductase [Clostridiales bacterium]